MARPPPRTQAPPGPRNSAPRPRPRRAAAPPAPRAASPPAPYDLAAPDAPAVYTPASNDAYWSTRPIALLARAVEVAAAAARWAAVARPRAADGGAAALRDVLVSLGPSFVKVGQALASRPDLLPPTFTRELEKLQDRIPPFPDADARAVIAAELGVASPDAVFSSLTPHPVAAASLGQVYKGTLRPAYNGGEALVVAVKVQRPGVAALIARDTYLLRQAAALLRAARSVNTDLPALVDDWASSLFRELDYRVEAGNGERFRELYGGLDGVFVPRMVPSLCTRRVLVMEWVDGTRLRSAGDVAGDTGGAPAPDALALVDVGVRCSLEQILEAGFFHSDPHPGNLLRTRTGQLAYLDFGMVGSVDAATRAALVTASLHLVNREYAALAADMLALGFFPPGADMGAISPALSRVFEKALAGGVADLSFSDLSADLGRTMYEFNFRLPPYYTLLVRSLSVLEGIALAADADYKVLSKALPWISRRVLTSPSPAIHAALRGLLYGPDGGFRFDRLERLLLEAAKSPPRRVAAAGSGGRARTADAAAPAPTTAAGGLALLLSPDAAFVRSIVVDELAKAVDAGGRVAVDGVTDATVAALRAAADAAPPLAPTAPPRALADAIDASVPRVATEGDERQVDGVARLATAFAALTAARGGGGGGGGGSAASASAAGPAPSPSSSCPLRASLPPPAATAADAAAWLLREAASLPPDAARAAAALPLEVAARAASRAVARGLRGAARLGPSKARPGGGGPPTVAREEVRAEAEAVAARTAPPPPPPPPPPAATIVPQVAGATMQAKKVRMRTLVAPE